MTSLSKRRKHSIHSRRSKFRSSDLDEDEEDDEDDFNNIHVFKSNSDSVTIERKNNLDY